MNSMGKYKILVNTTTLAEGDSIAAYLTSASGTLFTNTTVGGKQALDVYQQGIFAESAAFTTGDLGQFVLGVDNSGNYKALKLDAGGNLLVSAILNEAGDYAEDSPHTSGDVGYFNLAVRRDARTSGTSADGDYASFNVNSNGEMWVHDEDVLTALTAANASLDNIEAYTLTLSGLSKLEDAAHSSGDAGIQALAVRKDAQGSNVSADGDYSSLQTWSEGSLKVVDVRNGSILQQQVSVTSTAAAVPTAALANRKSLFIQNTGSVKTYIGSATVTTSGATTGIELPANSFIELEVGPAVAVYAVKSGGGSNTLNILEMA